MMFPKETEGLTSMKRIGLIVLVATVLLPQVAHAQGGDTVIYYHTDAIGSVRMITDSSGVEIARYDFLPFGQRWPQPQNSSDVRQFADKERDLETKLDYFGARYFRAESGRFTSVDPIQGRLADPQTLNRYAYARNNPIRFIDPTVSTLLTLHASRTSSARMMRNDSSRSGNVRCVRRMLTLWRLLVRMAI
jgi:RHS repeat-associated protein